jgi:hypothetical protein
MAQHAELPMKQISNHLAIVLTVLFVPGGLPIVFAMWAYRRRAKFANKLDNARMTLQKFRKTMASSALTV